MVVGRIALNYIYKRVQQSGRPALHIRSSTAVSRFLSSQAGNNDNNNDGEGVDKKEDKKTRTRAPRRSNEDAKNKLNDLLRSIIKEQETRDTAATSTSNDKEKIEFKLAIPIREKPPEPTEEELNAAAEEKVKEKEIGKELLSAVKTVAESVGGDPKEVETELVKKLKSHAPGQINLSELFVGMKIDRSKKSLPSQAQKDEDSQDLSRAQRVRKMMDERQTPPRQRGGDRGDQGSRPQFPQRQRRSPESFNVSYAPINLFGSPPLGIFLRATKAKTESKPPTLKTWDALHAKNLKLAVLHPPANGIEEMILWTEQGKLWKYPINNEQDLDVEAKVSFHEHVFLEPYIDNWCPKRGPIKHFMELVCVGLSKNPYMTVQEKKDHLEWYHDYFVGKSSILKEIGAGDIK